MNKEIFAAINELEDNSSQYQIDRLHEINADHLADNTRLRHENLALVHALRCWLQQANGDGLDKKSLTRLVLQSESAIAKATK